MIEWGAKFCWLFTYMPVGNKAVTELMVSAKQREYMYHQVRKFRKTKPLFTMDFWNDGEYVQGCIEMCIRDRIVRCTIVVERSSASINSFLKL